jgi:hypothetical protein
LDSSIVQRPVSVAPCQALISRFATFSSPYAVPPLTCPGALPLGARGAVEDGEADRHAAMRSAWLSCCSSSSALPLSRSATHLGVRLEAQELNYIPENLKTQNLNSAKKVESETNTFNGVGVNASFRMIQVLGISILTKFLTSQ